MDTRGIYPIIVIIMGYYTSNMETRLGELFSYIQQIETMYQEKLTKTK